MACPSATSTSVAKNPPIAEPARLRWRSSTRIPSTPASFTWTGPMSSRKAPASASGRKPSGASGEGMGVDVPEPASREACGILWWCRTTRRSTTVRLLTTATVGRRTRRCSTRFSPRKSDSMGAAGSSMPGCGPGVLTIRLAHRFEAVVGLDPDAAILAEGREAAHERSIANVRWVQAVAEDLPGAAPGPYRLVTFGQSFHWTGEARVAEAGYDILQVGGALAPDLPHRRRTAGTAEPRAAADPPRRDQDAGEEVSRVDPPRGPGRGARTNPPLRGCPQAHPV